MPISRIGASSADGTTITIPGHAIGDLLIIYAFRGATTAPTLATGWTNLGNASAGASSYRCGWRIAISGSTASGTWTNASGLVVLVYRGQATNKVPILIGTASTATSATVTYGAVSAICGGSWVIGFAATKTTSATLETAPTNLGNRTNTVGSANEYSGHDSGGPYTAGGGAWPSTDVSVGTSAEWRSLTLQILADFHKLNNYQFVSAASAGIISVTEKIR